MEKRLPSLNALRAFEAAARHGSLTRAATELNVTPGAIRHQIRGLEADLGLRLMERSADGVRPSTAAQRALPSLRAAFDALADANRLLREQPGAETLTVATVSSLLSAWLIPRLDGFRAVRPGATVRFDTKWGMTDFHREGVDLAIRYGPGGYPGFWECLLFTETYTPVCAPRLLKRLREPADLASHTLLHVENAHRPGWTTWPTWLAAAGVAAPAGPVDPRRGMYYSISLFADQAAVAGQGVALGSNVLTRDLVSSGCLVKPFDLALPGSHAYHIVCPHEARERPVVRAFIDWLLDLAAEAGPPPGGPLSASDDDTVAPSGDDRDAPPAAAAPGR